MCLWKLGLPLQGLSWKGPAVCALLGQSRSKRQLVLHELRFTAMQVGHAHSLHRDSSCRPQDKRVTFALSSVPALSIQAALLRPSITACAKCAALPNISYHRSRQCIQSFKTSSRPEKAFVQALVGGYCSERMPQ